MGLPTLTPSDRPRSVSPNPTSESQNFRQRSASLACPPPPPSVDFLKTNPKILFERKPKIRKEISRNDVMDELCDRLVQRRKTLGFIGQTSLEEVEENEFPLRKTSVSPSTSTLSTTSSLSPSEHSTASASSPVPKDPKLPPPPPLAASALRAKKYDLKTKKSGFRERSKSVFTGNDQKDNMMEELKRRLSAPKRSSISFERIEEESVEHRRPNGDVTHSSVDFVHRKIKNPIRNSLKPTDLPEFIPVNGHSAPECVKKAIPPKPVDSQCVKGVVNKFSTLKMNAAAKVGTANDKLLAKCDLVVSDPLRQRSPSTSMSKENVRVTRFVDIWETRQRRPENTRTSVTTTDLSKK